MTYFEGRCTDDGHPSPTPADIRDWDRELLTEEQQLRRLTWDVEMEDWRRRMDDQAVRLEQDNDYVADLYSEAGY